MLLKVCAKIRAIKCYLTGQHEQTISGKMQSVLKQKSNACKNIYNKIFFFFYYSWQVLKKKIYVFYQTRNHLLQIRQVHN